VESVIKVDRAELSYLKAGMIFWPVIAYAPFFFTQWVNPALRIGCFTLLSIYLFFSSKRYSKNDVFLFFLLLTLSAILVSSNSAGQQGLVSVGNYCLTLFFGWGLYRHLTLSRARIPILLGLYVKFFYLIAICSLLSLLYLLTIGELDLFGFKHDVNTQLVTPFGVHFKRQVGPVTFYRSFFYFVEAAHVGIFYAANIIIVAPLLKHKAASFKKVNFLGGLLSMSMTFYVVLFVLYGYKKVSSIYSFIAILLGAVLLIYLGQIIDVVSYSSSDDRSERFLIFFIVMADANISQFLFGHGVSFETGFEKAFNSGFTLSIYETGIVGTALQMIILYILSPSFILLIFFMLAAAVLDPIHMPLFLFLMIITAHLLKNEKANSKSSFIK
tara:strand:+ start:519 stop:1673 length:1155 start_codon:yes stop_codon:yes gene_type:complete